MVRPLSVGISGFRTRHPGQAECQPPGFGGFTLAQQIKDAGIKQLGPDSFSRLEAVMPRRHGLAQVGEQVEKGGVFRAERLLQLLLASGQPGLANSRWSKRR